jgi:two-component system, NtrC family, response regulator GlrR
MEQRTLLLLEFDEGGELGKTLNRILKSWPDPDFSLVCHTCRSLSLMDDELTQIIHRHNPLLILLALPHVPLSCLDSLFQILGPAASSGLIVVAVDADQEELIELVRPGIADFIIAPLRDSEVLVRIRRLLNQSLQARKTQQTLTEKLGLRQLIGQSPVFLAETGKIPLLARSDISVLIAGETGTGKEVVARFIHYLSPRAGKPFVPVNCGAIPLELLENELFGHDKGAFTGASGSRAGLIQEADKGTLFLDEVDSLPLLAQVKLLRFLQDKEYRPLGSAKSSKGDVRIIAASNANLEQAVATGALRRDLYYRLNVVPIVLPPLRERSQDILLLAHHFLAEYAAKLNSPAVAFSSEAERKLLLYNWPGNVRELEHVIERVVVLCTQKTIQEDQITFSNQNDQVSGLSFQEMKANVISQFESTYIQNILIAYKGNISKAARAAQKERRTFWELVRKHKINVEKFKDSNFSEPGNTRIQAG